MIPFNELLQHSLIYGAILSALLSALIIASLYLRPMIWIADATPEVQAVAPPLSAADRRAKAVAGVLFFAILIGTMVVGLITLRDLSGGPLTFTEASLATFIIFQTFNLVDLVVLDWLIVEWWRPSFITFPGAAGLDLFPGYVHHFVGFLKGTAIGLAAGLVVGVLVLIF